MIKREGRPQPYVGVSGIVGAEQQFFVEAYAMNAGLFSKTNRNLAEGIKATDKTQMLNEENKYGPEWYPAGDQFATAVRSERQHPRTLRVAQTFLEPSKLDDPKYPHEFMNTIHRRGAKWLQAVQFDMLPWDKDEKWLRFVDVTRRYFLSEMLLQCHGRAMNELGPKGVVKTLGKYASGLDYVLFDASHGTGKRMDASALDPFLEEAYSSEALANVGFAVAGGLNAQNVREDLPALVAKYPDLSWDAEGQLHPLNNVGKRPLQMDILKDYLRASVETITA